MRAWHLVHTRPRQEGVALTHLERQGYEAWLPLARESSGAASRIAPLFPRYLFVNVDRDVDDTAPIRSTRGCCGLVRFGQAPAILSAQAAEVIRQRCDAQGYVLTGREWEPGTRLKVLEGPFAGFDAIFKARSAIDRVHVLLDWLGRTQPVVIPARSLACAAG